MQQMLSSIGFAAPASLSAPQQGAQGPGAPPGLFAQVLLQALGGSSGQTQLPALALLSTLGNPEPAAPPGPALAFVPTPGNPAPVAPPGPALAFVPTPGNAEPVAPPGPALAALYLPMKGLGLDQTLTGLVTELPSDSGGSASDDASTAPLADQIAVSELPALLQTGLAPQAPPAQGLVPAPSPQTPPPHPVVTPAGVTSGDPALEAFVQQAVVDLMAGKTTPRPDGSTSRPSTGPTVPTFADLVQMVNSGSEIRPQTGSGGQEASSDTDSAPPEAPKAPETPEPPTLPDKPDGLMILGDGSNPEFRPAELAVTEAEATAQPGRTNQPQPDQVLKQVARSIRVMLDGKRSEVRLQLHPENLGTVAVRLVLQEGSVQAHLTARDPQVRQVLQANLDQLRIRFADQGLKVDHVHVSVGGDTQFSLSQDPHGGEHRQPQSHSGERRQWREDRPELHNPVQTASPSPWTPGRTGVRVNSLA